MTYKRQVIVRGLLISSVVLCCVAGDQLSKQWAVKHLMPGEPQSCIEGLMRLNIITNPGAAFSLGSTNGELMGVVATGFSIFIFCWIVSRVFSKMPLSAVEQLGMGCILGGAIGNLIDRYNHGQVTDFLEFTFISFPVFNVADALIDVGIVFLFLSIWFEPIPPEERKTTGEKTAETSGSEGDETENASHIPNEDLVEHKSGSSKNTGEEIAKNEIAGGNPTTQKTD